MNEVDNRRSINPIFGELLRFWREGFDLTQEELAFTIEVSPRHLSRLENARVLPSPAMVDKICNALGLTARDRAVMQYAASKNTSSDFMGVSSEPESWLKDLLDRLVATIDTSPAMVSHVSGLLVSSNQLWRDFFGASDNVEASSTVSFWQSIFASSEKYQPRGWQQTRMGLLLSFRQLAILRADEKLSTLYQTIRARYPFEEAWVQRAARIEPRPSFPVSTDFNGEVQEWDFASFSLDEAGVFSTHSKVWWLHVLIPTDGQPHK